MKYLYETHLHTSYMSRCSSRTPAQQIEYYHSLGYAGIIVTEHFFNNGSCKAPKELDWKDRIDCYRSSYYQALIEGKKYDMDIMYGLECTYGGSDFLVYGLDPDWLRNNPDMLSWRLTDFTKRVREQGAVVVHAHPFREEDYIDYIRLIPRDVDGVEIYNGNNTDFQNSVAKWYADSYGLPYSAGSDNHHGVQEYLGGIAADRRYNKPEELIRACLNHDGAEIFYRSPEDIKNGNL